MSDTQPIRRRSPLPQLGDRLFLTDGGFETTMVFHEGWDLPMFEAFTLVDSEKGRDAIRRYFDRYIPIATSRGAGFILESPTWRANPDWGPRTGYDPEALARVNRDSIALMAELRKAHETERSEFVISGCIGPRGDGYDPGTVMTAEEAEAYHAWQIGVLAGTEADFVTAITMTNTPEAIGVARAAKAAGMPCAISFTVETDGRLPTGERLGEAITKVDQATDGYPAYFMINCAHPTHFETVLEPGAAWTQRIRALRANSSRCSHAELDNAEELDTGNPVELGGEYAAILRRFPHITILGGCCGTDHRHIEAISEACLEHA